MSTSLPLKTLRATYQLSQDGITALKNKLMGLQNDYLQLREQLRAFKEQVSAIDSDESLTLVENVNAMQRLENEIHRVKQILASARTFNKKRAARRQVELGARVKLLQGTKKISYTIVTSLEADPSEGKISDQSPLGKALLGKTVKDSIAFQPKATAQPLQLKLLSIE